MKFYITKIEYNTEDGALPFIEGVISTEMTDSLLKESAIRQMVEKYKEELKEEILENLDYRQMVREMEDYIDFAEYVDYDDVAERVNENYIDYDTIADQVHDLIDYEDIVNRVIEEIKERL